MLDQLQPQTPDALLALIKLYEDDDRPDKIDLGVGVYRTADGRTPVFEAIKAAEKRLLETQDTKAYLGPEGDTGFVAALMPLIFGADPTRGGRIEGMQTPGGTGALRVAAALVAKAGARRVLLGEPSWPNHAPILKDIGLPVATFNHATEEGGADMPALREALEDAGEEDAILLHGCCHNPTGIDYTNEQWDEIAALLAKKKVLPIIDLAYHGLGGGLEEDAYGTRAVIHKVPEALIAYSCDKNFGLYRDRVGALYVLGADPQGARKTITNGYALARANWSMPPDHGAAAVRIVLRDEELSEAWRKELASMRKRIKAMRDGLAKAGRTGPVKLSPVGAQHGMFATLTLSRDQVARLREEHGIYMAGSGRINIAGLTEDNIPRFIAALESLAG